MSLAAHATKRLTAVYGMLLRRLYERCQAWGRALDGAAGGIGCQIEALPARMMFSFTPTGSELAVSPTTQNNAQFPAIAMDPAGDSVVVWQGQASGAGNHWQIYGQRYNASGAAQGSAFLIDQTTTTDQTAPQVAMNDSGAFVVTWMSTANGQDVIARAFNASGIATTGELTVSTTTTGPQKDAQVAMDSSGKFIVVWDGQGTTDNDGIYSQTFSATGIAQGANVAINTVTTGPQLDPTIAMNDSDQYVVAWTDNNTPPGEIMAQRYASGGTAAGADFLVGDSVAGQAEADPSAAIDSGGNFVIAWDEMLGGSVKHDIEARRYNASGTALDSTPTTVNITTQDDQQNPSVAMTSSGNYVVTWTSQNQDGNQHGVFGRAFARDGSADGTEFQVNTTTQHDQEDSKVAWSSGGAAAVVWDGQTATENQGVAAQFYSTTVSNPNVAPTLSLPAAQSAVEEGSLTFSAATSNAITVSDADGGNGVEQVTLTTSSGTLSLGSTSGITITSGAASGASSVTFTGALSNLNTALNGLVYTPTTATYGAATIGVTINDLGNTGGAARAASGSVAVNVARIAHTPSVTNATTNENTRSSSGLVITPASADTSLAGYFKITGVTGGTLYLNDGVTAVASGSYITFAQGQAGLKFTPTANSTTSGSFSVQSSTTASDSGLGGTAVPATITVRPVPVLSAPASQSTSEDTSLTFLSNTSSAITVGDPGAPNTTAQLTLSATDGTLTLASTSGLTFIAGSNGSTTMSVLGTLSALNAALDGASFTPSTHYSGSQAALSITDAEGSNTTSKTIAITVNATAHTPSITNATTNENTQSSSGLVITPNPLDLFVGNFQITGITGGTLYLHDGVTPISNGQFITFAQGEAGLKFTPAPNSVADGSFYAQSSTLTTILGLSGGLSAGEIAVNPVPTVTAPASAATQEDTGLVMSNATGNPITIADPGNSSGTAVVTLSTAAGTLSLASTSGLVFTSGASGSSSATFSGMFADLNAALDGLTFTPALHASGTGSFSVTATEGANSASKSVAVAIARAAHTPSVTSATTPENVQSSAGLVITPSALDTGLSGYYQITAISGGTLFQNDGVTPISDGSFINFAQGQAGLKFRPAASSIAGGSFAIQASTTSATSGLGGSVTTAAITVTPAPIVSVPAAQTTAEDAPLTLSSASGSVISLADSGNPNGIATITLSVGNGAVSLASLNGITLITGTGADDTSVSFTGMLPALNAALDGLVFTPAAATFGAAAIALTATEGSNSSSANVAISVTRTAHTPSVSAATTNENTTSSGGLVITPAGPDVGMSGFYKLTNITGGTLYQSDGVTPIADGSFITFVQGQAGLRFALASNSISPGGFNVQASTSSSDAGLGGSTVAASVAVNAVPVLSTPGTQSVLQGQALTFSTAGANTISVSDAGNPGGTATLSLGAQYGTITLPSLSGLTIATGANGSADISVVGTLSALNAALDGMVFNASSTHNGSDGQLVISASEGTVTTYGGVSIDITPAAHTPSVTNATTNENQQTSTGLVISPNPLDVSGYFQITSITGGTLFQHDGATAINNGDFITFAQGQAGLRFTPTANSSTTGSFLVQTSSNASTSGLNGQVVAASVTVNPVPTLAVPAAQATQEDAALTFSNAQGNPIVVSDPGNGGAAVQVSLSATAGTISLADETGLTIVSGADGSSSLTFSGSLTNVNAALDGAMYVPASHMSGSDTLSISAGEGANVANGSVAISIARVAHTPSVTGASTNENQQTASGLVLSPATLDNGLTGYFKITSITGGSLFQSDGTTPIHNGDFITFAQGQAGLRFTPASNSTAPGSFGAQASTSASDAGLGGSAVSANIAVFGVALVNTVATQIVNEDMPVVFSSASGNALVVSDPGNPSATVAVTVAAIHGVVSLASTGGVTLVSGTGTDDASVTFSGTISAVNAALDGASFVPSSHYSGPAALQLQVTEGTNTTTAQVAVSVTRTAHTPTVTGAATFVNQQTASGLVITPNALDNGLNGYFKITALTGGTLYQHDGVTPIASGSFITFAQGQAGLRFTPAPNSAAAGSFVVQASSASNDGGLNGSSVTASVSVDDPPHITLSSPTLTYTENQGPAALDAGLTLTDSDSANLVAASVHLLGYTPGEDAVQYTAQHGIVGTWNAQNATLLLSGTATVGDYQSALRSIKYSNNSENPTTSARTIQFSASDGIAPSGVVSRGLTVVAVNDPPVLSIPGAQGSTENAVVTFSPSRGNGISLSDVDAGNANEQVTISVTGGMVRSNNAADWQRGITLNGTLAELNASLDGIAVRPDLNSTSTVTIDVVANDLGNTGTGGAFIAAGSITLSLTALPITINAGSVVIQQALPTTVDSVALQTRRSDGTLTPATYSIVTAPVNGSLVLDDAAIGAGAMFTQQDVTAGRVHYVPTDPAHPLPDSFSVSASDPEGAVAGPVTVAVQAPPPVPALPVLPLTYVPIVTPTVAPTVVPTTPTDVEPVEPAAPASTSTTTQGTTTTETTASADPTGGGRATREVVVRSSATVTPALLNGTVVDGSISRAVAPTIELSHGSYSSSAAPAAVTDESINRAFNDRYNDTLGDLTARRRERLAFNASRLESFAPGSQFSRELDAAHEEATATTPVRVWAGSASFVSIGMSVVYFIWALRAGSLVSSLLSSMPAWKMVDPLPILEYGGAALALNPDDKDDKALGDLLKGNA